MVKEIFSNKETLLFDFVSIETVLKEYTLSNDIRTKIVKANADSFFKFVSNGYNKFANFHNFLSG